ncbi:hypothetical protein [Streptomyces sp. NPDC051642]
MGPRSRRCPLPWRRRLVAATALTPADVTTALARFLEILHL